MATPIKKTPVKKEPVKAAAPKKAAVKKPVEHKAEHKVEHKAVEHAPEHKVEHKPEHKIEHKVEHKAAKTSFILDLKGRYSYAVGRRKTSVANIRLFNGSMNESKVNKKDFQVYFNKNAGHLDTIYQPLRLTGLESDVYFLCNVKGGGINSQATAVAHGIAQAIAIANEDFRKVLKKNGLLTRDSRMKERKKPGLKRARRGPQWAKR